MFNYLIRDALRATLRDIAYMSAVDKFEGEPVLAESALVHAKTEHMDCYIIHFYIAARDTVVNCAVPYEIYRDLEMKKRGTLTHQGGLFFSFETEDTMYCEENISTPAL